MLQYEIECPLVTVALQTGGGGDGQDPAGASHGGGGGRISFRTNHRRSLVNGCNGRSCEGCNGRSEL